MSKKSENYLLDDEEDESHRKTECQKVSIEPEWVFGIRTGVQGLLAHMSSETILFPAGHYLIIYDTDSQKQNFVSIADEGDITGISLSSKKQYLAISGTSKENAAVSVWEVSSWKKLKMLSCSEVESSKYISITFSSDERLVAAQGGEPDWTLVLFLWEKAKVFSVLRLCDTPGLGPVIDVSFHPEDSGILSLVGERVLKLLKLNDKLLKTWGYQAGTNHNCVSQVWADQHTLLAGTDEGTVLVLEEGDLRAQEKGKSLSEDDPAAEAIAFGRQLGPRHKMVTAIQVFSGGFICACGPDHVFVFQKSDNIKDFYQQRYILRLCEPSAAALVSGCGQHTITDLSINPGERTIIAVTHTGQMFANALPSLDEGQLPKLIFDSLHALHHEGNIVDASVCVWKPWIITAGSDSTVRLWDYEEHILLLQHIFKEDIFSVSLHPSGFHAAVGLTDNLWLMHILFGSMREYSEIKVRRCTTSNFSHGGHLFAAAENNHVIVASTMSFKKVFLLKGHTNKVTCITWAPDDSGIISCATDGRIIIWESQMGRRTFEITSENCRLMTSGLSLDNKTTILAARVDELVEIAGEQIVQETKFQEDHITCVALSPVKTLLVLGASSGNIYVNKFPLHMCEEFRRMPAHSASITKVIVTHDEKRLMSVGNDGMLMVWVLDDLNEASPGYLISKDRLFGIPRTPEMLIRRADLEESRTKLKELENKVVYLHRDKTHHLALQQREFEAERKQLIQQYEISLKQKSKLAEALEKEQTQLKEGQEEEMKEMVNKYELLLSNQREETKQKLLFEYSKQDKLETTFSELQSTMDRKILEAEERTKQAMQSEVDKLQKTIADLTINLEKSQAELERERTEGNEIIRLVEAATDVELSQARSSLHAQLTEERGTIIRLRSEKAALQKTLTSVKKECDSKSQELKGINEEMSKLHAIIKALERDAVALGKEVTHRDDIIQERESKCRQARRELSQLEKHRFLLENRLSDMHGRVNPLEEKLNSRARELKQLEDERTETRLVIEGKERLYKELSQKLLATKSQIRALQHRIHQQTTITNRVLSDIVALNPLFYQPKKLRDAIKQLHSKYVNEIKESQVLLRTEARGQETEETDDNLSSELLRQRELLENTVSTLNSQIQKLQKAHHDKVASLVKENMKLLDKLKEIEKGSDSSRNSFTRGPRLCEETSSSRRNLLHTISNQAETISCLHEQVKALRQQNGQTPNGASEESTNDAVYETMKIPELN